MVIPFGENKSLSNTDISINESKLVMKNSIYKQIIIIIIITTLIIYIFNNLQSNSIADSSCS